MALFVIKVYRYSEGFSNRHFATFFERSVLKEVRILRYLYNNIVYQSSKTKFFLFKFP